MPIYLRRVICCGLAAVMAVVCSVQAFAAGKLTFIDISEVDSSLGFYSKSLKPIPGSDGDYSLDLKVAEKMDEEQQRIWSECMRGVVSGEWIAVFEPSGSTNRGDFRVCFFPDIEVPYSSKELGYYFVSNGTIMFRGYRFSFNNINNVLSFLSFLDAAFSLQSGPVYFTTDIQFFLDKEASDSFPYDATFVEGINSIQITDDLEGEPEPEPEPDPKPPYNPQLPTIPEGNPEYVPYDTSIWEKFLTHIKGNIGSSTSVGFLILAAILGVLIVIRVVRKFSKA